MTDREEAIGCVERWRALNAEDSLEGRWAVERRADGVVAGTVILVRLPDGDGELEVGWHLHPDSWGQGLASEAARAVLGHAFGRGVDEVFAVVRPDNAASLAVCRRIGMEPLGRTDRYYGSELELFRIDAQMHGDRSASR
jgi:RimJ/RimL family protein N-acetyltransferase